MKQKIMQFWGWAKPKGEDLHNKLVRKFSSLEWRFQAGIVVGAAVFVIFLSGILVMYLSARSALEAEALNKGLSIAGLLAAENALPAQLGQDTEYSIESAESQSGVLSAFVVDSAGLIVAPPGRFHEDMRKDGIVKRALAGESVTSLNGSVYELGVPIKVGTKNVGAARIAFSPSRSYSWSAFLGMVGSFLIMLLVGAGAVHVMQSLVAGRISLKEQSASAGEQRPTDALIDIAEHINSPIITFDRTFRASFANSAALSGNRDVLGRHIIDIDDRFIEMAEELEMHQKESVQRNGAVLWRLKGAGYALTY